MSRKMLKTHLSVRELRSRLYELIKKQDEIIDIVVFGSFVKGKEEPGDIDLAIILKEENYALSDAIISSINKTLKSIKVQVDTIFVKNILKEPLYLTLLHEGFSIRQNKFISSTLKTKSAVLFSYSLAELNRSQKTMFGYALRGRTGQKGLLHGWKGEVAGRNSFIVPIGKFEEAKSFLKNWNVSYSVKRILELKSYI